MLWNKVMLIYDGSESSLRAVEYVAKMFGKTEGLQVTILGVHERIPRHDLKDTSPVVDKLQAQLSSMEREVARGQARIMEAKALLSKAGVDEEAINIKFVERKQAAYKDIAAEAVKGGYGTLIIGRRETKSFVLAGGDVAKALLGRLKSHAVCVV